MRGQTSVGVDVPGAFLPALPFGPPGQLVLVVQPDASVRSLLELALARAGYEIRSAASLAAALEFLAIETPQLMIVASSVGVSSAHVLGSALNEGRRLRPVPVMVIGNEAEREFVASALSAETVIETPAFARDVAVLTRLLLALRNSAKEICFSAGDLPPGDLLRALLSTKRSGRMVLADGRGDVTFCDGQVASIDFEGATEIDSLTRALAATSIAYKVVLEPGPSRSIPVLSARDVVGSVLPFVSSMASYDRSTLSPLARLMVNFERLATSIHDLPTEAENVVRLFDGKRVYGDVARDSPYSAALTLQISLRLYELGMIVPVAVRRRETPLRLPAPRLFEEVERRHSHHQAVDIPVELMPAAAIDHEWIAHPNEPRNDLTDEHAAIEAEFFGSETPDARVPVRSPGRRRRNLLFMLGLLTMAVAGAIAVESRIVQPANVAEDSKASPDSNQATDVVELAEPTLIDIEHETTDELAPIGLSRSNAKNR